MGRRIGTLGLVNYRNHPTDKRYKVFAFYKKYEADHFEELLEKANIWFEKDEEQVKEEIIYLYAVDKNHVSKAHNANYMVSAKFRKKIINNGFLRYSLLIIVFGIIALAAIGYVKNMMILDEKSEEVEQIDVNS